MMSLRRFHTPICSLLLAASMVGLAQAQTPVDNLNLRYANGIVAIAEEKVITVDDVRREIGPLVPELQRQSRTEQEFNEKLEALQNDVIQNLIDRVLIVKEFYKDEKRRVPSSYIDNQLAETIITQFENDRSKYLAYLRSRGISQKEYRRELEEDMIYNFMRQQQSKSGSTISPVRIEDFYNENKERFYQEDSVQLRLIQIARAPGESDDALRAKAAAVVAELDAGADFGDVARKYSQDSRKSRGGDWGWQRRSDLRKEFSDVIFTLDKGKRSEPLLTPEGAFLFLAEDRKHAGNLPIDEVRPEIERALVQQGSRRATERWLEKLRRNAYVKHF
ncbi:Putative peptidyl-prolyl cis-trans isomerase Cbf2 precursor [Lacunisphaera limnophila]|uniref:Peptidyl-prolyl cis-trans isomerase Cbf2 n=1 Tax=Lacunisphaera limnophila TaxID=1838286 RepID=A0A1D8AXR5_9BACT|nr:peptidylprolyl isomerase [Lacunisphaera limnophila]AOS45689.1 Putative peptidyl-prolyl cis-trans isomerase Cbf2 precursor [Lacunisphaera limnophila]